ncbi:hypothetical protein ACC771_22470, partial [Rhizobium ruizarguesonis]
MRRNPDEFQVVDLVQFGCEDLGARLCVTTGEKWRHVARRVREVSESGRPVLIGTRSVEASEALSVVLGAQGLQHTVLNARQ